MITRSLLLLALAVVSTPLIAADYMSTSSANNMPNANGQFVYTMPDSEQFIESKYVSTASAGTAPTDEGKFIFFSLNDCTINCAPSEYISTSPANNMPDMNGRFIYKY